MSLVAKIMLHFGAIQTIIGLVLYTLGIWSTPVIALMGCLMIMVGNNYQLSEMNAKLTKELAELKNEREVPDLPA